MDLVISEVSSETFADINKVDGAFTIASSPAALTATSITISRKSPTKQLSIGTWSSDMEIRNHRGGAIGALFTVFAKRMN